MKRYFIGLFLILLIIGCQQQPATTAPEPTGQAVAPQTPMETEDVPPETEEVTAEEEAPEAEEAPEGGDVSILGKEGFEPAEITVKKGATVVFMNNDPQGKIITLTFQKDKGRKFDYSGKINAGEKYEHTFEEAGTYDYWAVQYAPKGKIIVE